MFLVTKKIYLKIINLFSIYKFKEYYVLNDLDNLNTKNNKIIFIDIFNNVNQFRNEYNKFTNLIIKYNNIINNGIFYKMNSLFYLFIKYFNKINSIYNKSTLENIDSKYYKIANFKSIDNKKKIKLA